MRTYMTLVFATLLLLSTSAALVQAAEERPGRPPEAGFGHPRPGPGGPPPAFREGQEEFGGPPGARRRHGARLEGFREELKKAINLTPEQEQEMRKLRADFREKTRKARTALFSLMDEKISMLSAGKIDVQKLTKLDEEIVKARTDLMRESLLLKRDQLSLLSEEQRARLGDFLARKKDRLGSAGRHLPGEGGDAKDLL